MKRLFGVRIGMKRFISGLGLGLGLKVGARAPSAVAPSKALTTPSQRCSMNKGGRTYGVRSTPFSVKNTLLEPWDTLEVPPYHLTRAYPSTLQTLSTCTNVTTYPSTLQTLSTCTNVTTGMCRVERQGGTPWGAHHRVQGGCRDALHVP